MLDINFYIDEAFADEEGRLPFKVLSQQLEGIWVHPGTKIKDKNFIAFPNGEGWERKEDNKGLLEEFRSLASAKRNKKIEKFAQKWGPLWVDIKPGNNKKYLLEPIETYREQAQAFQDIITWFAYIKKDDKQPPKELVDRTPIPAFNVADIFNEKIKSKPIEMPQKDKYSEEDKETIKRILINRIQENIDTMKFELIWDKEEPKLEIRYGFGIIPIVWLQLAQALSESSGIYLCNGCKKYYVREGKAPAKGRYNFCEECAKHKHRIAKRLWVRNKRKKIKWVEMVQEKLKEAKKGELTLEEFKEWLGKQNDFDGRK